MRICFQVDLGAKDGWNLAELQATKDFEEGTKRARPEYRVIREQRIEDPSTYDMVGFFGVANVGLMKQCLAKKVPFLYFDKPYNRIKFKWWKMSIWGHHPTKFLNRLNRPDDRRKVQGWEYKPWRKPTEKGHILLAGSSNKYHKLYDLPHPTEYWVDVAAELRKVTDRLILYRPKKSWKEAIPIDGTKFSTEPSIIDDLRGAHCMITHGSNACFEALLEGIPTIMLGEGITAPISSQIITAETIEKPYEASSTARDMILNNLAYFQWETSDLKAGRFWPTIDDCLRIHQSL